MVKGGFEMKYEDSKKIILLKEKYENLITEYKKVQKEVGPITAEHIGGKIIQLSDVVRDLEELLK